MSMLAEVADAVIGIDTHRDSHEVEIADAAGRPVAAMQIGNDSGGFAQLLAAIAAMAPGPRVAVSVDPHKLTHTASAIDGAGHRPSGSLQVDASLAGYRRLLRWAGQFSERRWAVENARGLGRHLSQWLTARGEHVVDVPSTATARVRELSRGGRRKNDVIDAAAAAAVAVAVLQGDAVPVLINIR